MSEGPLDRGTHIALRRPAGGAHPAPPAFAVPALVCACPLLTLPVLRYPLPMIALAAVAVYTLVAVTRPRAATLVLLAASPFAGTFPANYAFCVLTAVLGTSILIRLAAGRVRPRAAHLWITVLVVSLLTSFAHPQATLFTPPRTKDSAPPNGIARLLGLGDVPAVQIHRLVDFTGLLCGLAVLAIAVAVPPRPRHVERLIVCAGTAGSIAALAGTEYVSGRLGGLGLNPNYLGVTLAIPITTVAGVIRRGRNPAWLLPAVPMLTVLAATQSRSGMLCAVAGTVCVLVSGRARRSQALAIAAIMGLLAAFPGVLSTLQRLSAGDRPADELVASNDVRHRAAAFAAQVAAAHPGRGVGYGMFASYARQSADLGIYLDAHNDYLRLASEDGIIALATFGLLLWLGWRRATSAEYVTLKAVVFTFALGSIFETSLASLVVTVPFWVSLGCLLNHPVRPLRNAIARTPIRTDEKE